MLSMVTIVNLCDGLSCLLYVKFFVHQAYSLNVPFHWLLFFISSKESFTCTTPQTGYYIPQPLLHMFVIQLLLHDGYYTSCEALAGTRDSLMVRP